jgi:fumarate reductase flavoprotein subunit
MVPIRGARQAAGALFTVFEKGENKMQERTCDILVLGGGGSGLVAAARAAELSGKQVVVLEKGKVAGGGMLFASTMRTFGSRWQAERGIPDQSNDFIRTMMDLTMWKLDPKLVKNAILGTGQFFDWYAEHEEPEVLDKYEARPYVFDIPVGGQPGPQIDTFHHGSGQYIMAAMLRACGKLGVDVLTEHRAVDAEVTNGRITAVIAQTPEGTVRFSCRVCILACGSWIRNKEVVDKVLPAFNECEVLPSAHLNPAYTGDGLPIAEKAGAFVDWDSFCLRLMGPLCAMGDRSKFDPLTHGDCAILVDLTGKRFVAEPMVPRMDPFDTGHIMIQRPKGKAFFLYSANTLKKIIADSQPNQVAGDSDVFGIPPLPEYQVISGWFDEALAKGSHELGKADTVEALARQLGLDPAALRATVDQYNAACAQGTDWDYFKDPATMVPLTEGPFFALSGKLSTDGAFGGVRVDPNMQAYRPDGSLVPGLFVTGDFASGRHIVMSGVKRQVLNDMSWALSSGFLAGTAAAKEL